MTLVSIGATKFGMEETSWASGGNILLDASGEKAATVLYATYTDTITHVLFRTGTVTTPQPLRVGIETVDANGDPSGTQYGGSVPGILASPASNTTYEVALATPASSVVEDEIAFVVQFDGTVGNLNIAIVARSVGNFRGIPYSDHFTGSWLHSAAATFYGGIRYSTYGYQPVGTIPGIGTLFNCNTGTTPNEMGNQWTPVFACAISGLWMVCDADGGFDAILYDTDLSTVLAQVGAGAPKRGGTGQGYFEVPFTEQVLTVGQPYGMTIKPTTTTTVIINRCTVQSSTQLNALWLGSSLYEIQRVGSGSWTHNTAQRILIGPIISKLDNGIGGGAAAGGGPLVGGRLA